MWAERLLRWYCREDLLDEIEGDLTEQFAKNIKTKGLRQARLRYALDVIRFFRPSSFKKTTPGLNIALFTSYLRVALRVFIRDRSFTLTNGFGLSLAIICSGFIFLWVDDELKFNSFPHDKERICYVMVNVPESGIVQTWKNTPYILSEVLKEKYPAIETAASVSRWSNLVIKHEPDNLEPAGLFASPELFEVFSIPFRQGSAGAMHQKANTIVISASLAERYFGPDWERQDHRGTILSDVQGEQFELAGIFEDIPEHSTLRFDYILPMEFRLRKSPALREWHMYGNHLYVKLAKGYTVASATANVRNAISENSADDADMEFPLLLQPFADLYLYSNYENGQIKGGRIDYVRLLSLAAILVVALACINFTNLATVRAASRSKETGIRKVMGAGRLSLGLQFVTEAFLITTFAFLLSIFIIYLLLPYFNILTDKSIQLVVTISMVSKAIAAVTFLSFFAGIYPALYMATLHPLRSLKGLLKGSKGSAVFRKGLVAFQYVITVVMIIAATTVYLQTAYIFDKKLGMDRENVIKVPWKDIKDVTNFDSYRHRLRNMPGIQSVTTVDQDPLNIGSSTNGPSWEGAGDHNDVYFHIQEGDPDFIPTMNIEIKEGRNFSWELATDVENCLINETAAKAMGLENPVGKSIKWDNGTGTIIGVVKDFHFKSLHSPIEPLIIRYSPANWLLLVKTGPGRSAQAIASLEKLHAEFRPDRKFEFEFLDTEFNSYYRGELLVKKLALYFAVVAIVIACMGQLSLVSFSATLKTKEIGIRKVLGAPVASLLLVIAGEFVTLVLISAAVAMPLAMFVMEDWLSRFAYRIELNGWVFLGALVIAVLFTVLSISHVAVATAMKNPVNSLRQE